MLPQGFTRVEWIHSDGGAYINSKLNPNGETRIVTRIKISNHASYPRAVFGERNDTQTSALFSLWLWGDNQFRSDYGPSSNNTLIDKSIAGEHGIDKNKNVTTIDSTIITVSKSTWSTTYPIYLFSNNYNNAPDDRWLIGDMYDTQMYDGSTLARDYIAAKSAEGVVGFYDDANAEFYASLGSAQFTAGPVIDPGTPSGLIRTNDNIASINLSWTGAEYANHYVVYRDGIQIADTVDTEYTDTTATPGAKYIYKVTAYNGTQAGGSASITISTALGAPTNLTATLDGNTVILIWEAVSGADGYYVYRNGMIVGSVASASYTDILTPPVSASYAVSAYSGTAVSGLSNAVIVENWEGVILTLITDRTAADVSEAKHLRDKLIAGEALTDEESARYFAGLRGCYNASDMNRVGAAVRYVADRLNAEGYGAYVSPKTDWQMEDIVRQNDWNKYLDEVRHLRRKLTLMRTTPQITDGMYGGLKSYAEANAIEQILVDLDWMLTNIIRNYIYAGEVFAGEV